MTQFTCACWSEGSRSSRVFASFCLKYLWVSLVLIFTQLAVTAADSAPPQSCVLVEKEGKVELSRKGSTAWVAAQANDILQIGDRLRTGLRSRATLRWSELSVLRVSELTSMEIQPPAKPTGKPELDLKSGTTYFFSREKPEDIQFRTPVASGAIRGTEFNLAVADDGETKLALLDGEVDISNSKGAATLKSGEQAAVQPGGAPSKTALIDAVSVIQWALYYPAVVDPNDLGLSDEEKRAVAKSLDPYRQGDLLGALAAYPEDRAPGSDAERLYHATLLLAAGRVDATEAILKDVPAGSPVANALRELIAAVKHQTVTATSQPTSGSEWMARSYYLQSRSDLPGALKAASEATRLSPNFGAAWVRNAELEFGFGHTDAALSALNKGLDLSPRNAEGLATKGFLLAAKNESHAALAQFDQAIAADGALPNSWLGRGLVKWKISGRYAPEVRDNLQREALEDMQVAATLEPNRAVLRCYLGKAFAENHDVRHARKELDLARTLDPNDPTSWLYLALLNQQENRVNEAVNDLKTSEALNGNRSIFRSRLLLDEDQAVRSANLAAIYRDEGMQEISVQEAARAVDYDYGNYSAHLFLANSYDSLRDPNLINLRYETPWFSQLLVANLLQPVSGGNLSQNISQQEYSKFFAADGVSIFSDTFYTSHGDWQENASIYGVYGNTGFSIDGYYRSARGYRPNNDIEQEGVNGRFKQQITEKDSVFLQVGYFNQDSGDVAQYYDQYSRITNAVHPSATLRVEETQDPNLLLGYHREWAPGSHTLFLATRFDDTLKLTDSDPALLFLRTFVSPFTGATNVSLVNPAFFSLNYKSELVAYSAELQQIWENHYFTTIAGLRYQDGSPETTDNLDRNIAGTSTPVHVDNDTDLNRISAYLYEHWQVFDSLRLIGGVSYDHLRYPVNIDTSPISGEENTRERFSPKAGILWSPLPDTHLRGVYTRSLGGAFFDSSVRLEPTEIAGFNQAFRSMIPESVEGLVPGTVFETYGVGIDQSFKSGTYLFAQGEILNSDASRTIGVLTNSDTAVPIANSPGSTGQTLSFEEKTFMAAVNQLISKDWALGARYRITDADLNGHSTDIPSTVPGAQALNPDVSATLQQLNLFVIYQHRCGFFSEFEAIWSQQSNRGYTPDLPGDDFWQYNLYFGYRMLQRRVEARLGILNLTDQNYRLNPLTLYNELPRERLLTVNFKFNF